MTSPLFLIAGREFRTYVATLSFWLSLSLAPLGLGVVMLLSNAQPASAPVSIRGGDPALRQSASLALQEAGRLEGRTFVFRQGRDAASIVLLPRTARTLELHFSDRFPLSAVGRAMVGHMIERDAARRQGAAPPLVVREKKSDFTTDGGPDAARLARLTAMAMLWLTLTGSLGMLLQAVVRERANRSLESLLAAASAREIVTGKLLGVGAVSLLIVAGWLGSAAAFSFFQPPHAGLLPAVLTRLADPVTLLRDGLIYLGAFVFYGAATLVLGALARDSAAAQNLVRPMFVLLLAAFFLALAGASSWLVLLPPFAPFLLLASSPGDVPFMSQAILMTVLLAAGFSMLTLAARLLSVSPDPIQIFVRARTKPQPLV